MWDSKKQHETEARFSFFCIFFQWYNSDLPESEEFPNDYSKKLKNFQKLMLLRCFRVDRVYQGISNYVAATIGEQYITPPFIR